MENMSPFSEKNRKFQIIHILLPIVLAYIYDLWNIRLVSSRIFHKSYVFKNCKSYILAEKSLKMNKISTVPVNIPTLNGHDCMVSLYEHSIIFHPVQKVYFLQ